MNIGVNIIETSGRISPGILAAATSVAGFVVQTANSESRGKVTDITSLAGFMKVFGAPTGTFGAIAIKGFFDNGGSLARVVGIAPPEEPSGNATPDPAIAAYTIAIAVFERAAIQLLVIPDCALPEVCKAALDHCEMMGDRVFVGHLPAGTTLANAETAGTNLSRANAYGALYYPWIKAIGPSGTADWAPPSGHIAGVYARTERDRGIWKAPAGNAANVRGAVDIALHLTDVEHTKLVREKRVNAIRALPGRGIVVDSARSLSSETPWVFINVRLLMNFIKSSLKDGLNWAKYEPNDAALWNRIKHNTIVPFLMGMWRRGAFGSGDPASSFTVVIDESNNSAADIAAGQLNVAVTFFPSRPAETIVISIGQQEAGTTITEG